MRYLMCLALLLLPMCALGYAPLIAQPDDAAVVLPLSEPSEPQEFFGELKGFPHTFQFSINDPEAFKAAIYTVENGEQTNDISIIVIKEERRGVAEIGRTRIVDQSWEMGRDTLLAESFRYGGSIDAPLEPGVYRLEVSSPNNNGKYRLVLGNGGIVRGYFDHLRVLFTVKSFFGSSFFTVFFSPLVYIPLFVVFLFSLVFFAYIKRRST